MDAGTRCDQARFRPPLILAVVIPGLVLSCVVAPGKVGWFLQLQAVPIQRTVLSAAPDLNKQTIIDGEEARDD